MKMRIDSEVGDLASNNQPISRLNWPTAEQLLAARRERGRVLRAMIASVVRKVLIACARGKSSGAASSARPATATRHQGKA